MKAKKLFATLACVALMSVAAVAAFTTTSDTSKAMPEVNTHAAGKHCNYSVGCSCPGFSPITNGTVAQQSYCKHCGHHKSYHR